MKSLKHVINMKYLLLPLLLFVASCSNQGAEKTQPVVEAQPAAPAVDNSPQMFFTSANSCGDSKVEILSNSDGTFTIRESKAGISSEVKMQKEALVLDGKSNVNSGEVKLKGNEGSCVIAPGKCDYGTHRFILTLGERTVECCGSYSE
jgi:hypothetical protein